MKKFSITIASNFDYHDWYDYCTALSDADYHKIFIDLLFTSNDLIISTMQATTLCPFTKDKTA